MQKGQASISRVKATDREGDAGPKEISFNCVAYHQPQLRRHMIEDMTIRKFAEKTQHGYMRRVMILPRFSGDRRIRQVRGCAPLSAAPGGQRRQLELFNLVRVPTLGWICSTPLSITLLQQLAHAEYRGSDIARKLSSSAIFAYDASAATNWCRELCSGAKSQPSHRFAWKTASSRLLKKHEPPQALLRPPASRMSC